MPLPSISTMNRLLTMIGQIAALGFAVPFLEARRVADLDRLLVPELVSFS